MEKFSLLAFMEFRSSLALEEAGVSSLPAGCVVAKSVPVMFWNEECQVGDAKDHLPAGASQVRRTIHGLQDLTKISNAGPSASVHSGLKSDKFSSLHLNEVSAGLKTLAMPAKREKGWQAGSTHLPARRATCTLVALREKLLWRV